MQLQNLHKDEEGALQLLKYKIATGSETAFTGLYRIYKNELLKFAQIITHSKDDAEDAVEEVFLNIWLKRSRLAEINNLKTYLYTSVKNRSLNKINGKDKQTVIAALDVGDLGIKSFVPDPQAILVTAEMLAAMDKAVDDLPPRCKMIFKMVREDGLKYKDVATALNISINTIDAQMAIAIKKIAKTLQIFRKL